MGTDEITREEIARRQRFARSVNAKMSTILSGNNVLETIVALVIWHGSLPRGEGGSRYDFDYAAFMRAEGAKRLLDTSNIFISEIEEKLPEFVWRKDLHYDGISMFEAHSHLDPVDRTFPHAGVHIYQEANVYELLGEQTWRTATEGKSSFFRELYAWQRFCLFYRHWIFEGIAVHDPQGLFREMQNLDHRLPKWMQRRLEEAVQSALVPYKRFGSGLCAVGESRMNIMNMIAMLAYSKEDRPMGRPTRYVVDMSKFKNRRSRQLIKAVVDDDLGLAAGTEPDIEV